MQRVVTPFRRVFCTGPFLSFGLDYGACLREMENVSSSLAGVETACMCMRARGYDTVVRDTVLRTLRDDSAKTRT